MIVHAEDDLRGTVEATLNIRIDYGQGQREKRPSIKPITLFVFKAAAAKIDDFNGTLGWMLQ